MSKTVKREDVFPMANIVWNATDRSCDFEHVRELVAEQVGSGAAIYEVLEDLINRITREVKYDLKVTEADCKIRKTAQKKGFACAAVCGDAETWYLLIEPQMVHMFDTKLNLRERFRDDEDRDPVELLNDVCECLNFERVVATGWDFPDELVSRLHAKAHQNQNQKQRAKGR